jgi:hypothetical protein
MSFPNYVGEVPEGRWGPFVQPRAPLVPQKFTPISDPSASFAFAFGESHDRAHDGVCRVPIRDLMQAR